MKIAVIGAGAAGLVAAGFLGKNGLDVTVFEKREKVGRKLLITGKGRCNVLNNCEVNEYLENIPRNSKFLYSAIRTFTPQDTMDFFEEIGVKLKTERGKRVFPESDKAMEVVDKLLNFCRRNKVKFVFENITEIGSNDGENVSFVATKSKKFNFDKVIIATGGLSYPKTGSSGDGYKFAQNFGHDIVKPEPSLVALVSDDDDVIEMQGLALKNVKVTLNDGKKDIFSDFGEMLFTHFGVSGPVILSSSAHITKDTVHKLFINLKPALDENTLDKRILKDFEKNINRDFANSLNELLPKKLIPVVINRAGIDPRIKVNLVTKEMRKKLIDVITKFRVDIVEKGDISEAIITRGGVNIKEVNPKTMESKKMSGLYFIGEVLDVDGYTGGFNLQIAWSTAYSCAKYISELQSEE